MSKTGNLADSLPVCCLALHGSTLLRLAAICGQQPPCLMPHRQLAVVCCGHSASNNLLLVLSWDATMWSAYVAVLDALVQAHPVPQHMTKHANGIWLDLSSITLVAQLVC